MLVLTRRVNEAIQIGNDITVTVAEVKQSEVTLLIKSGKETTAAQRPTPCREKETIEIAAGIAIILLRIQDEKARLGIRCPLDVPIHRREIYEAIGPQKGGSYTVAASLKPFSFLATHKPSGEADMNGRFTDRARKVMQLANQEAQRFNHEYIGTEHILLGLIKEGGGVAANVLKNLDVDLRMLRSEVEKIVQRGQEPPRKGKLPQTPRSKKVMEYSLEEARKLNHNYVGTEHLLLGLLREQEGVAAQVLMNLGLKLEWVREEVLNLLGHGLQGDEEDEMEDAEDEAKAVETQPAREPQESFALSMESHGVLQVAEIEAQALNHGVLSTGHLLLGLTLFSGDPLAALFQAWKITVEQVRAEFDKLPVEYPAFHKSPAPARTESLESVCLAAHEIARAMSPLGKWLEQTGRLEVEKNQAVAAQQFEKAAELRDQIRQLIDQVHDQTWDVTPAHLLFGLLGATDSLGVRILQNLGFDPEQLHDEVRRRLKDAGK